MKVYLASPYGFTEAGQHFMFHVLIPRLEKMDLAILNPWDALKDVSERIHTISKIQNMAELKSRLHEVNQNLAENNANRIKESDIVIAILDGQDVDSGVAAEIGYAYALQKPIIGYRSDFRVAGDNMGTVVNLQVEWFIENSGGHIVTNLEELAQYLREHFLIKSGGLT